MFDERVESPPDGVNSAWGGGAGRDGYTTARALVAELVDAQG
jgi:hypothetical protein